MTSSQDSNPASFYASPHEACHATPEEFLHLACVQQGTGWSGRTSSPSSTPQTAGSCRRRRCRTTAELRRNDYRFISERALDACTTYEVESISLLAAKTEEVFK
jgi:hypothetical protein